MWNFMYRKLEIFVYVIFVGEGYRIAENVGRRKHWLIDGQLPKFSPSNLWNRGYTWSKKP